MKNLKNTISALSLMAVLGLGAVAANAGLMVSDRSNNQQQLCASVKDDILTQLSGIIILGAPMLDGIIILGRDGLMISDKGAGCGNTNGLMISDRNGLIISD